MEKADAKALKLMNDNYASFEEHFRNSSKDRGNKWDDIIVKFEGLMDSENKATADGPSKIYARYDELTETLIQKKAG